MNDYLEMKKEIEKLRRTYGDDGWLHGAAASKVENLLNISKVKDEKGVARCLFSTNFHEMFVFSQEVIDSSYKEDAPVWSHALTLDDITDEEITNDEITIDANDETPMAAEEYTTTPQSSSVVSSDSEDESGEN